MEEGSEGSLHSAFFFFFFISTGSLSAGEEEVKSSDLSVANSVTLLRQDYFISEGKLEAATAKIGRAHV